MNKKIDTPILADAQAEGTANYCPNCKGLTPEAKCPACGRKKLKPAQPGDSVFLGMLEGIWVAAFEEMLTKNNIPSIITSRSVIGRTGRAVPSTVGGYMLKGWYRVEVPAGAYEQAIALYHEHLKMNNPVVSTDTDDCAGKNSP